MWALRTHLGISEAEWVGVEVVQDRHDLDRVFALVVKAFNL